MFGRRFGATAVVAAVLGLSLVAAQPAQAYSSLDNPQGLAIVTGTGAWADTAAITVAAGAVGAGVGIAAWKGGMFDADGSRDIGGAQGSEPGWLPASTVSVGLAHPDYKYGSGAFSFHVDHAPDLNGSGAVQVSYTLNCSQQRPGKNLTSLPSTSGLTVNYERANSSVMASLALDGSQHPYCTPGNNSKTGTATIPAGGKFKSITGQVRGDGVGNQVDVKYLPNGDPTRPAGVEEGAGTVTRTIWCQSPDGQVATFSDQTPGTVGTPSELPALGCPDGSILIRYGSTFTPAGETVPQVVIPETAGPGDTLKDYQACWVEGSCTVELYRITPQGLVSCMGLAAACPDWYSDPLRADNYECHFGPYVVALSSCSTMRTPGVVRPNVETKPDGTAEIKPWPSLKPSPALGEDPAVRPDGLPWTPPEPGPGPGPAPHPADDPQVGKRECFPRGWQLFNPAEWVLKPMLCAFVPRSSTIATEVTMTKDVLLTRPPLSLTTPVVPVFTGLTSGWQDGCSSAIADFDPMRQGRLRIPCTPPMGATFTAGYAVAVIAVVAGTAFAVWHMIGAAIGANSAEGSD